MIVEYIRYEIPDAQADAFLGAYERAGESMRASPHCRSYELTRCSEEPTSFILRITWDSAQGHLEGFRKSPLFRPFLQAIQPYIGAIKEMRHYALTPLTWSRGPE